MSKPIIEWIETTNLHGHPILLSSCHIFTIVGLASEYKKLNTPHEQSEYKTIGEAKAQATKFLENVFKFYQEEDDE